MNRSIRNARGRPVYGGANSAVPPPKPFVSAGFEPNSIPCMPVAEPQPNSANIPVVIDMKTDDNGGTGVETNDDKMLVESNSEETPSRPWYRGASGVKKKPTVQQKRIRRNRTLRKLLTPKNALMALYELKGNQLSEYTVVADEKGFVATFEVNGHNYTGRGISKISAKNNASEKALRDLIIRKMAAIPRGQPQPTNASAAANSDEGDDADMSDAVEEEVPMMHLASFALHKLFSEWQAEGYEIPDFKTGPLPAAKQDAALTPRTTVRTGLPAKYENMHPSMLLALMRPSTQYIELGHEGITPNIIHRVAVQVDGRQYVGAARSKKLARKDAAAQACNSVFNCEFKLGAQLTPTFS